MLTTNLTRQQAKLVQELKKDLEETTKRFEASGNNHEAGRLQSARMSMIEGNLHALLDPGQYDPLVESAFLLLTQLHLLYFDWMESAEGVDFAATSLQVGALTECLNQMAATFQVLKPTDSPVAETPRKP